MARIEISNMSGDKGTGSIAKYRFDVYKRNGHKPKISGVVLYFREVDSIIGDSVLVPKPYYDADLKSIAEVIKGANNTEDARRFLKLCRPGCTPSTNSEAELIQRWWNESAMPLEHIETGDRDIDALYDTWRFPCCGYTFSESRIDEHATELVIHYCPNCGHSVC